LVGSYVVNVGEIPVYTVGQVKDALSAAPADRPTQVVLTLAPEPQSDNDFRQPPLHLQLDQLLRVHSLQSTSEQEKTPKDYKSEVISNAEAISSDHVSDFKTRHLISRLIHIREHDYGRTQIVQLYSPQPQEITGGPMGRLARGLLHSARFPS
jgi:hypothetical protein